ncbi:MAG: formamidopyrimidine-DNA glycosylase [Phycisphaerales bacterium]|nr:formamidopyrimidine-DNA glycosylase [Phycisphaerales bacterium]
MPELPDIALYIHALGPRILGKPLTDIRIKSPFLLRTFEPAPEALIGPPVRELRRLGKRIVLSFDNELHAVLHLMIAGRLLWKGPDARPGGRIDLAAFNFEDGTLMLTEASPKKRASLHIVRGAEALRDHDPAGLEPLGCSLADFSAVLMRENRTLKRALTDPSILSGVGNAFSDEILFAARLSPVKLTRSLSAEEMARLHEQTAAVLNHWIATLQAEFAGRFPGPGDITAFRPDFNVHGRFGKPCRACGSPIQRIVRGDHETNYCAACQTGGKLLADRSLSRLLKDDWPATIEEWEETFRGGAGLPPAPGVQRRRPG